MKIIDSLGNLSEKVDLSHIKDFDYTQLSAKELFDGVKRGLQQKENWFSYGPVTAEFVGQNVSIQRLQDDKIYPTIEFLLNIHKDGISDRVIVSVDPFKCLTIDADKVYMDECRTRKNISQAIRDFMVEKFGLNYIAKRNEYFAVVKNLKIAKAKQEADEKIRQAEKEFEEIINDI